MKEPVNEGIVQSPGWKLLVDLVDLPQEVLDTVDIRLVESIDEVLKAALLPGPSVTPAQIEAARPSIAPPPAH